jgi:hypothetical protein
MNSIALITAPMVEPVTLAEAKLQCGFGPVEDSTREASSILNDKLRGFIAAARQACENYTRSVYITQRWLLRSDAFPGLSARYEKLGYPQIDLSPPPFQSVDFFKYVDVAGNVQALTIDATYGTNPTNPQYGYQLERGSETQAGRLLPPFARPWPPTRMVPSNVMVQFRCGFGGPITVSTAASSAALTASVAFNPDDAPLIAGDTGLPISIPGAGVNGAALNTFIAAVDVSGNATLRDAAAATVASVTAWAGRPVPEPIRTAIKMTVEHYYNHGGSEDVPLPRVITSQLEPYRNLVA